GREGPQPGSDGGAHQTRRAHPPRQNCAAKGEGGKRGTAAKSGQVSSPLRRDRPSGQVEAGGVGASNASFRPSVRPYSEGMNNGNMLTASGSSCRRRPCGG